MYYHSNYLLAVGVGGYDIFIEDNCNQPNKNTGTTFPKSYYGLNGSMEITYETQKYLGGSH
jgi:hypothetical protein